MNAVIIALAKKKWFVPLVIFLMLIIALTSLTDQKHDATDPTVQTLDQQLEALCNSVAGVRNAKVMIAYESATVSAWNSSTDTRPKILGIAVVCDGGDDPRVQLTLHRIIEALFDISSTRITISQRNQS